MTQNFKKSCLGEIFKRSLCLSILIASVQSACDFNPNCDAKCLGKICEYDPSTNSYYNSSISNTSAGYHGMGCCTGCAQPYIYDHYYDSGTKSCFRGSCTKDANGVQQYWFKENTCRYDCSLPISLYKNSVTGTCEYRCSNGYYRYSQTKQCLVDCPSGFYKMISSNDRYCKLNCSSWYANNDTGFCESPCTTGYADSSTYQCVATCPNGTYKDIVNVNKRCVSKYQCWNSRMYVNEMTKTCQSYCSNDLYADQVTTSCSSTCFLGYYKSTIRYTIDYQTKTANICINKTRCNKQGPHGYVNNNTLACEENCSGGLYGDKTSGYCVVDCPNNSYKYETSKICVDNCSSISSYAVLDSATNSCQIQFQTYYGSTGPSSPSNTYYTIVISQTVGIIILAGLLVVGVGMITCAVYMIRRIRLRRHYVEAPINITNDHINVQYNQ